MKTNRILISISIFSILVLAIVASALINADTTPPASITNLKNITYKTTYINWTWKDPTNTDFAKVMVYIDGTFKKNVTKGIRYYKAINLLPNTSHRISTHTVDTSGNINKTWINHTARTAKPTTPNLGVFYYPWTGGNPIVSPNNTWRHWKDDNHHPNKTWAGNYLPDITPGVTTFDTYNRLYSSKDIKIINKQFELIQKAGIGFIISSWWGQNSYEDQALNITVNKVIPKYRQNIKFAIYYEKEGFKDVPKSEIISDINYIKTKYASNPSYLKINGRAVVFVYNADSGLSDAQKWSYIRNKTGIYTVLKIFSGYQDHSNLADSWHEYAPAIAFGQSDGYSAFISPGFWKWHESPRLAREDFVRFENNVKSLKNAIVQFKLIETWNEWGEGTGIEPAQKIKHDDINGFKPANASYGTKYIDILSKYFSTYILVPVIMEVKV